MLQTTLSEQQIQRAVFDNLRHRGAKGAVFWHPFSGGYRRPKEAAIYKGLGAIAGLPDVMAIHKGIFYALELKTLGSRPTEAQLTFIAAVNDAGGFATWCEGLDRALHILETWQLLVGRVT